MGGMSDYERFRDRAEDALQDAAAYGGAYADRHVATAAVYAQLAQAAAWREK